jgi:hypothetical protein
MGLVSFVDGMIAGGAGGDWRRYREGRRVARGKGSRCPSEGVLSTLLALNLVKNISEKITKATMKHQYLVTHRESRVTALRQTESSPSR